MLTVSPEERSNIEKICSHWWVNVDYKEPCLDVAEELANQTPVRLDLLLSLAPPPPPPGSEKIVVTDEASGADVPATEPAPVPTRSQSVGSLMDLAPSAERRIRDLTNMPPINTGAKRKEPSVKKSDKEPTPDTLPPPTKIKQIEEREITPIVKSSTEPIKEMGVEPMDIEPNITNDKTSEIGAACKEIIDEINKTETKKDVKPIEKGDIPVTPEKSPEKTIEKDSTKSPEGDKPKKKKIVKRVTTKKIPSEKKLVENTGTEPKKTAEVKSSAETKPEVTEEIKKVDTNKKSEDKIEESKPEAVPKVKEIKPVEEIKKVENKKVEEPKLIEEVKTVNSEKVEEPVTETKSGEQNESKTNDVATAPTKPIERRRSKIFERAEKLENMAKGNDTTPKIVEKPKKIFIPGVNVGGFKKEFERKASLTSTTPLLKTTNSVTKVPSQVTTNGESKSPEKIITKKPETTEVPIEIPPSSKPTEPIIEKIVPQNIPEDEEQKKRRQNAVNIITSAINKEGARKSKSRPSILRKTPLPFGASGRSASGNITMLPLSPPDIISNVNSAISEESLESAEMNKVSRTPSDNSKKSTVEITLRSSTLPPQRKTAKAEIKLNYPPPKPVTMEFKTEMAHHIEAPQDQPFMDRYSPATMKFR